MDHQCLSRVLMLLALAGGLWTTAQAGNVYIYQDSNGSALLTNKKISNQTYKQVKVTYYPDTNVHSYSNWGKSEAAVLPSFSKAKNAYDAIIRQAAQTYNVSEGLIKAVMHTESGFNFKARSPVGAQGLMQLMPATARRFSVTNAYDPVQNIHGGAKYLSWLLKRFNNNTTLALAAYNAGEGNVDKYNGVPPFRETQDYVRRVTSRYQNLYGNGLGTVSASGDYTVQAIQTSHSSSSSSHEITTSQASSAPQRDIVFSEGRFTNNLGSSASRTYVTDGVITQSNISVSHY